MPIHRVTCAECGLAATHVQSGDRGVTSFSEEEAGEKCSRGVAAREAGDAPLRQVARCEHLKRAIADAIDEFKARTRGAER
ncbi:MAG: hypothetical protein KJZ75_01715 [Hyphomonadaceae bacterium]|nr:hypothetical protein [Hyphomonadaceae bacterium]